MGKVGTAEYDVLISRAKVQAEVAAASRQIEQGFGASARKVESQFASTARAAVGGFVALKGGQFLNDATQAASNLAEAQTKAQVVFGDSIASVQAFGDTAAESIGQSERQALEAAGTFGNLFRAIGLSEQQSAEFSVTLTTLASDLASFNNASADEALTALRSGLVGETEPLKRFGVNLNEATLKAKALQLGLAEGTGALDANAKAQAAYAIILEQTALAQGDFERTSDGLANKQRIATAEYEDARAELGEGLLPIMKQATDIGITMTRAFSALPEPLQLTTVGIAGATLAVGLFGPAVSRGAQAVLGFGASQATTAATTTVTTRAVDGQTAALLLNQQAANANATAFGRLKAATSGLNAGAITSGLLAFATSFAATTALLDKLSESRVDVDELTESLGLLGKTSASFTTDGEALNMVLNDLGKTTEGVVELFQKGTDVSAGESFANITGVRRAQNELKDLDAALTALYETDPEAALRVFGGLNRVLAENGVTTAQVGEALPKFTDATGDAAAKQRLLGGAAEDTTAALAEQAEEQQKLVDQFRAEQDATEAANQAKGDTLRAYADLQAAQAAARGDSDEYRAAQERIVDAERAVADAQREVTRAQEDLTDARKRAAETLEDLRFAAEGSVLSEERARLRLDSAREEEAATLADPLASERDRQEAILARKEAELALREAQDRRGDSAAELADAEAKGVEGSDEVTAAKERVAAANEAQRAAEEQVGEATRAAADVIAQAKQDAADAAGVLEDAVRDEATAQGELASATGDVADGIDAEIAALFRQALVLDPASPVRRNLLSYIEDLERLRGLLDPQADPVRPTESSTLTGTDPAIPRRPTESVTVSGGGQDPALPRGRSLGGGSGVTQNFYANDFDEKALANLAGQAASDAGMGWGG
ncbi:MAG: hypothetical protein EKK62_07665 [Acidimicrobiia bacterium]|nr:MAG: hypothetical protein EKK62_07665 [Acidimicrobiia bacterium]